jgi:hypothetical protein
MSIEDRNLKPGTVLVGRYHKKDHRCEVVKGEEGKVRYRLKDGREFTSPSAAGSAVMDGVACNGWRFWTVEGTEPARKAARTPTVAKKAKAAPKPARKAKAGAKAKAKAKARPKVKGGSNGKEPAPVETPVSCGDCGAEFPNSREAAEHMRDEHNSSEAAGSGGR